MFHGASYRFLIHQELSFVGCQVTKSSNFYNQIDEDPFCTKLNGCCFNLATFVMEKSLKTKDKVEQNLSALFKSQLFFCSLYFFDRKLTYWIKNGKIVQKVGDDQGKLIFQKSTSCLSSIFPLKIALRFKEIVNKSCLHFSGKRLLPSHSTSFVQNLLTAMIKDKFKLTLEEN
jgi:hypothetical protein